MSKIDILKALIAKEDDDAKRAQLEEELLKAIKEEAKAEAMAELAKKDFEEGRKEADAREKAANTGVLAPPRPAVKVLETDNYLGYNLKAMKSNFLVANEVHGALREKARREPEGLELVMKWWAAQMAHAIKGRPEEISKAAMVEGTTTLGGYLTPTEERMAVLSYIREVSLATRYCSHVPMVSDSMTIPRENYKVSVAFTNEATDATETSATFAQVTLTAKRLDAYTKVSNELLQDAANPGGIAAILASQFIEAVGQKIDSAVFIGTGDPVSGVFLSAGSSEVFSSGSTHFSELLESNIRNAVAKIRTSRLANARWYCHRTPAWTYLYGLQDSQNRPLFFESHVAGVPHQILGYPLELPEQAPSASAESTGFIVFGDLSGFILGDRLTNVNLFIDPYSLARSYQTQFLLFTRWAFAHGLNELYTRIATGASE